MTAKSWNFNLNDWTYKSRLILFTNLLKYIIYKSILQLPKLLFRINTDLSLTAIFTFFITVSSVASSPILFDSYSLSQGEVNKPFSEYVQTECEASLHSTSGFSLNHHIVLNFRLRGLSVSCTWWIKFRGFEHRLWGQMALQDSQTFQNKTGMEMQLFIQLQHKTSKSIRNMQ